MDVWYEDARLGPAGQPVRYWIDRTSNTVWKTQYVTSDDGEVVTWTVAYEKWIENQPPPAWAVEGAAALAGQDRSELVGKTAPDIQGHTLTGDAFRLSDLRGKLVVLDLWSTSCLACGQALMELEHLRENLAGHEIVILSVTEDDAALVKRWMAEQKRTFPIVLADHDTAFRAYSVDAMPDLAIIDREGKVVRHWTGFRREKFVRKIVLPLL